MSAQYVIGIDLGTTNTVLAFAELESDSPEVQLLQIPQIVAPGTIESRSSLPSFVYLANEHELGGSTFDLPWRKKSPFVAGELARKNSAEAPDRTVTAAKSWLCHHRVDRRQAILPWNASEDVAKISPVTASQRYIEHLMSAWNEQFPDAPFVEQEVIVTVPASFDPIARELTREAALAAGLPTGFLLLEEPQAALYAWLSSVGDDWRQLLKPNDTILVCDVGGGTTDLSLIRVVDENGELSLQRAAVGDHLLVGGDNMDLAMAHYVAELFKKQGVKLNPWQSVSLWHSCRNAKEQLLKPDGPETQTISVLGRGSKVIGDTISVEINRRQTAKLLKDGFLPVCSLDDRPTRQRSSGFQEIGLPFESDPGISRHLAAFLSSHENDDEDAHLPNRILFNGGVFKSEALRDRMLSVIKKWTGKKAPKLLDGEHDLDHAVARGAAYYGWAKKHRGVRIRGGVARSYYVGIETAGLAIPGAPRPLNALCVVPFGMEEGTDADVDSNEFGLILGESTQFRFFSSTVRKQDKPGDLLREWDDDELSETDPLEANLPPDDSVDDNYVPVRFVSKITEIGMFELWCRSTKSDAEWKLEFNIREESEA